MDSPYAYSWSTNVPDEEAMKILKKELKNKEKYEN